MVVGDGVGKCIEKNMLFSFYWTKIFYITYQLQDAYNKLPIHFRRNQFCVHMPYAMIIDIAQYQKFDKMLLFLHDLYLAMFSYMLFSQALIKYLMRELKLSAQTKRVKEAVELTQIT